MIELVIVSRLLEYPDAALWQHQQEMFCFVTEYFLKVTRTLR